MERSSCNETVTNLNNQIFFLSNLNINEDICPTVADMVSPNRPYSSIKSCIQAKMPLVMIKQIQKFNKQSDRLKSNSL